MPIEITASDLLSFHKDKYLKGDRIIRGYIITNGINIFSKEGQSTRIAVNKELECGRNDNFKENREDIFYINDIVIDEDTLNQWEPDNSDIELKKYYDAQQYHKRNFLKEINTKGLLLKGQDNNDNNDNNKIRKLQNLNY